MKGKYFRQIFAEIGELRDDEQATDCDAPVEGRAAGVIKGEVRQGQCQQTGEQEKAKQGAPRYRSNDEQSQDDPTDQAAHLLTELGDVAARLDGGIERLLLV